MNKDIEFVNIYDHDSSFKHKVNNTKSLNTRLSGSIEHSATSPVPDSYSNAMKGLQTKI